MDGMARGSMNSGGAFQVETTAQNLGLARCYNMVYRTQSMSKHGVAHHAKTRCTQNRKPWTH
jgi:hypothetical protein